MRRNSEGALARETQSGSDRETREVRSEAGRESVSGEAKGSRTRWIENVVKWTTTTIAEMREARQTAAPRNLALFNDRDGNWRARARSKMPPDVYLQEVAHPRQRPSRISAGNDWTRSLMKIDHIARMEKKCRIGSLDIWRDRATSITSAVRRMAAVIDAKWPQGTARMVR
jgi:hypothetical protein